MNQRRDNKAANPKTGTSGISEEELNAFVDGELDRERTADVAALVELDTDLQQKVAEIKQLNDQLRAFGRDSDNDALPPRIRSLVDSWLKRT
jgi:anti-sigma factor RsiW